MCGGTLLLTQWMPTGMGLSPRVRGNRIQSASEKVAIGSIPACAGEPSLAYSPNAQ